MVFGASEELFSALSGTAMTAVGALLGAPGSLMACASIKSSFQLTTTSIKEAGAGDLAPRLFFVACWVCERPVCARWAVFDGAAWGGRVHSV